MTHPIPTAALDDRLGFLGTSGSGKTYNAGGAVERLLARKARVVIVDPLGVWWGLRLLADGKHQSPFNVAIFGGPRGDLPLTENAGALIGETAATMAESCIIDLRELGAKVSERRFMMAFLETLYRKAGGEPFHLVVDEADLFAPQKPAKGAETLLGDMENIVRRGRVKGFIPWLISQRPAVLNKNVLSQVDGLIAFKLTSSQDRDALDAWIEGQADKAEAKAIKDQLPALDVGQGVIWLPGHGILKTAAFPPKETFDSSRTPKRGEKAKRTATLKPLDLGELQGRLAAVEAEAKASDPKALRAQVTGLKREIAMLTNKSTPAADPEAIKKAEARGFERARKQITAKALREAKLAIRRAIEPIAAAVEAADKEAAKLLPEDVAVDFTPSPAMVARPAAQPNPKIAPIRQPARAPSVDGSVTGPQAQLLQALAWWKAMGHDRPTRVQVATICGWRVTSGHVKNVSGSLRTLNLIDYPTTGTMALTPEGEALAPPPNTSTTLVESVRAILTGPQRQAFEALLQAGRTITRDDLAASCGWEPTSGHVKNVLGSMRSLEVIEYPSQGTVALAEWLGMEKAA